MRPVRQGSVLTALGFLCVFLSCRVAIIGPSGQASLSVTADVTGTAVSTVVVEVTAPDISAPLVFNLAIVNGVATGTITLPAGSTRTIAFHAFDGGGVETHSGSVTVDVQAGTNPTISVVLTPLTGDIPIHATLGSVTVTVAPTSSVLSLGAAVKTVQLAATLLDAQGQPSSGIASWATHNPGIAVVDATGLVTAVGVGQTNVVATFQGAAGATAITVTP